MSAGGLHFWRPASMDLWNCDTSSGVLDPSSCDRPESICLTALICFPDSAMYLLEAIILDGCKPGADLSNEWNEDAAMQREHFILEFCFSHGSILFFLPSRALHHHNCHPSSIIYGPHIQSTFLMFIQASCFWYVFMIGSNNTPATGAATSRHQRWFLFSATSLLWMCLFTLMCMCYIHLPFMSPYIALTFKSSASTSVWFHGHDHNDDQLSSSPTSQNSDDELSSSPTRSEFK